MFLPFRNPGFLARKQRRNSFLPGGLRISVEDFDTREGLNGGIAVHKSVFTTESVGKKCGCKLEIK